MDWITNELAIGNHAEGRDLELLRREGFRSVLSLDGSLGPQDAEWLGVGAVAGFDLIDGDGNEPGLLGQIVSELEELHQAHAPVLVHCHAGRSRSVVVVAAFLARSLRIGSAEALDRVAAKRVVCIAPELEDLLHEQDWCA